MINLPKRKPAELLLALARVNAMKNVAKGAVIVGLIFGAIGWIFNINVLIAYQLAAAYYGVVALVRFVNPGDSTDAVSTNHIELLSAIMPEDVLRKIARYNDRRADRGGVQYRDLYKLHNELFVQEKDRLLNIKKD